MRFTRSSVLPQVIIVTPDILRDDRGHFICTYQAQQYEENGIPARFVQDNMSRSGRNVLRGLHYQLGRPQGKLIWAAQGTVLDVAVDVRRGSPNFGRWEAVTLSGDNGRQVYIPEGFAHGFCVTSESAIVAYKCTDYYASQEERGIRWDDPFLAIKWPAADPIVSEKDRRCPTIEEIPQGELPAFRGPR